MFADEQSKRPCSALTGRWKCWKKRIDNRLISSGGQSGGRDKAQPSVRDRRVTSFARVECGQTKSNDKSTGALPFLVLFRAAYGWQVKCISNPKFRFFANNLSLTWFLPWNRIKWVDWCLMCGRGSPAYQDIQAKNMQNTQVACNFQLCTICTCSEATIRFDKTSQ